MPPTDKIPADPFVAINESRLQRDIAAVERRKTNEGITWGQYLGGVVDLLLLDESAEEPVMVDRIANLRSLLPDLQEAERLDSPEFPSAKRQVIEAVQDTMIVKRELMNFPNSRLEEEKL